MEKNYKLLFLLTALILISAATVGCAVAEGIIDYEVKVMLASSDNLTVNGESVVTVKAGESVVFDVSIPEGMKVASATGGAYYEDGKIKIDAVYFPVTVKTVVREYYNCTYSVRAMTGGTVTEVNGVTVREDEEITVKATPKENARDKYVFAGWTDGKSLDEGGEIISTDATYTFKIAKDMELIANFLKEGSNVIKYHTNGGTVAKTGGEMYVDTVTDEYHFYPNALPDMDYFERDGYVLYGYNTAADGTGEYFGLGWNIITDETVIDLYCMWAKESPAENFTVTVKGKEAIITGYSGDEDVIVIPEKLKGKTVTTVADKAFKNAKAHTVIMPKTMTTLVPNAFFSCDFKNLYMPDTVVEVSDSSFLKCDGFSTLYVNAASHPKYQTYDHGTYAIKYERLVYATRHDLQKLVFTSGSNGTYGVYSQQLEEGLRNEYYVIDYSLHYQTCGMFFIDLISAFLEEDDILLFLPEPNEFQLGTNDWNSIMWQFFEAAYGCVTNVDIRDYDGVFDTFAEYNRTRQWMAKTKYTQYWNGINRYGDNDWYRNGEYNGFVGSQGTYMLYPDHINAKNINSVIAKCQAKGAKTYLSFPSLNKHALDGPAKKENHRKDYEDYIRDNLDLTVISSIEDYIFNGKYMSGTNYHLSSEGTELRTERLISDLRAQLKKDYPDKWGK